MLFYPVETEDALISKNEKWLKVFILSRVKPTLANRFFMIPYSILRASLVAQTVKNLSAAKETWIGSLGWEDSLEKGIVLHSSIFAWRIPWTEEPGGL